MLISRALMDRMLEHAVAAAPRECCGVVSSLSGVAQEVYCCTNVSPFPERSFEVDHDQQVMILRDIARSGWDVGAIYHSHPGGMAYPSVSDLELAFYPDALTIVIGMEGGKVEPRAFLVMDRRPVDAPLTVVEEPDVPA